MVGNPMAMLVQALVDMGHLSAIQSSIRAIVLSFKQLNRLEHFIQSNTIYDQDQ